MSYEKIILGVTGLLILLNVPVDAGLTEITVCPVGCNYTKIQDAINNASDGDTILVYSGTYYENVDVNKKLILSGKDTGGGPPVVDAGRTGSAITLSVDGINLDGFVATNTTTDSPSAGIIVYSNNNIIENNYISNNPWYGIYLNPSSYNVISGNVANNNGIGISVYSSVNTVLKSNRLTSHWSGIYLFDTSNTVIAYNDVSSNQAVGIYSVFSHDNSYTGNRATGSVVGIYLMYSGSDTLRENLLSGNSYNFGIVGMDESNFNNDIDRSNLADLKPIYYLKGVSDIIIDSTSNAGAVYCIECNNITVKDLILTNNSDGIFFYRTNNSRIQNNWLSSNWAGTHFYYSSGNTIIDNAYNNNGWFGILFEYSDNNTVTNNKGSYNSPGIYLALSSNGNTITNNNLSNNWHGILIFDSGKNILRNNLMTGNNDNFGVDGSNDSHFDNDIDTSNRADGKPIYYLKDVSEVVIDGSNADARQSPSVIYCIRCNKTIVRNQVFTNNYHGILLYKTNSSKIERNTFASNNLGISFKQSSNNIITGNNVINNTLIGISLLDSSDNAVTDNVAINHHWEGILLRNSNRNIIKYNKISNNGNGITLSFSNYSTVLSNNVSDNQYGISLMSSQKNLLYYNNLVNNTYYNAYDAGINSWDNGKVGNHYGDYDEPDEGCIDADHNNICDSPHSILGGSSIDMSPLISWNSPTSAETPEPIVTVMLPSEYSR